MPSVISILGAVIPTIAFLVYASRRKRFDRKIDREIIDGIKNPALRQFLGQYKGFFQLKVNGILMTIILPILITVTMNVLLIRLFRPPLYPGDISFFETIVYSSFMVPIEEQFVQAVILGFVLIGSYKLLSTKRQTLKARKHYLLFLAIALIIQAVFFAFQHENFNNLVLFASRFFSFLLYGALYVSNRFNLLPAIIAHATHNFTLSIGLYPLLFPGIYGTG